MSTIVKKIKSQVTIILVMVMVFCVANQLFGQSISRMKRMGDESFLRKDYFSAAKWYAAVLYDSPLVNRSNGLVIPFQHTRKSAQQGMDEQEKIRLVFQLAESYRLYNQNREAIPQYEACLASQDARFPLARLWYAVCLLANDQAEKAMAAFTVFLQKYKKEDEYKQKALMGIADCNFVLTEKKLPVKVNVSKIASTTSFDGSNFALRKNSGDDFWFSTSRQEINSHKEKIFPVRLYSGNKPVEKIAGFPAELNMAASCFSPDRLTLYFTGWKDDQKEPVPHYQIYFCKRTSAEAKWSSPGLLPASVNAPGFNAKQPFITDDDKYLLFVSDQPGGAGKYDIWRIDLENGKPVNKAVNLGSKINSKENEASPFYDSQSGTLYFSTDGRTGMGGMDIYRITGDIQKNQWNDSVTNLGYPVNSVKNDLYYTKDSAKAYLSSDRASSCCLEIFQAVIKEEKKDTVVPALILASVKPVIIEKESSPVIIAVDSIIMADSAGKKSLDSVNAITIERLHVNYRFASTLIRPIDYEQLDNAVSMLKKNPLLNILVASFTDCVGSIAANKLLSQKRSASVKAYLLKKGIALSRINIDFFGKQHMILACVEDKSYIAEKQIVNRRSELIITTDKNPKWTPTGKELDLFPANTAPAKMPAKQLIYVEPGGVKKTIPLTVKDSAVITTSVTKPVIVDKAALKNNNLSAKNIKEIKSPADSAGTTAPQKNNSSAGHSKYQGLQTPASPASGLRSVIKNTATEPGRSAEKTTVAANRKPHKDSVHTSLSITSLLDLTPRLKMPGIIEQMTSRTPRKSFQVFTASDSVKVELYDNGVFDYDTVSVIYNKSLVVYKQLLLTNKPVSFYVKLSPDQNRNEMIFFAENLGLTPPNSALMVITDGDRKRTEINVSSDLDHNAVIYFIKVNK